MTAPASLAALLARRDDLTEPREWLMDETEPLEIARERIALQRDLWHAVRDYETANRHLDEQAAGHRRAEARRAARREAADTDAETAEQTARRAAQVANDRRGRVRLHAEAQGLTYLEHTYTDADGIRHERHTLSAPDGHPALTDPASPGGLPIRRGGGVIVPTLDGDTLEAVEDWLGLPQDPSAGGPPPFRYRKQVTR
ncbi:MULTISPECIES: hypothetical protein [Dietzia]|uniref:hypothetical protein n=1 Tax=Dietzia TaxID=37914 RepID=UPI000BDECD48|nr:hypothetical protein [Dietzia sp. WMMA184]